MGFYDSAKLASGERYLILNDLKQEVPTGRLKVVGREMRKSANFEYPVLQIIDESGNKYAVSAWLRDVKACVLQWGEEPLSWGEIEIIKGKTRLEIKPCEEQTIQEMRI